MTGLEIRLATMDDAAVCGRIMFDAFESLATRHAFPMESGGPLPPDAQMAGMLSTEGIFALVAERDGEIVGSAFQDERGMVVGIGPVSVDPAAMDAGVGRALMEALLRRCAERHAAGIRLVQTAYHYRSLSLYAKLGFAVRETLSVFDGSPRGDIPGATVRSATPDDIGTCDAICHAVHGHDRHGELRQWVDMGSARVVERGSEITGYATGCGYLFHAVGKADDDVMALLGAAETITGLGVLVPSRNTALMAWCFDAGMRIVQQSTLMSIGLYNEPRGSWLPSIGY
jgi:GNAT superfamily N-acetyltransferase